MGLDNNILITTAATIGVLHTITGPDHYLPFIVMSKARKWSISKTLGITFLCGIGHVGSSILIGVLGIFFGWGISNIEPFESLRGNLAAWLLIVFGFIYFAWGLWKALNKRNHKHYHYHLDGSVHKHHHNHSHLFSRNHDHSHEIAAKPSMTPWILFTIFVLGPCEPLIPILMYPAATSGVWNVVFVSVIFSFFTIATMMITVYLSLFGVKFIATKSLEKYMHAIAGGTICLCGVAIVFLGL